MMEEKYAEIKVSCKKEIQFTNDVNQQAAKLSSEVGDLQRKLFAMLSKARYVSTKTLEDTEKGCQQILKKAQELHKSLESEENVEAIQAELDILDKSITKFKEYSMKRMDEALQENRTYLERLEHQLERQSKELEDYDVKVREMMEINQSFQDENEKAVQTLNMQIQELQIDLSYAQQQINELSGSQRKAEIDRSELKAQYEMELKEKIAYVEELESRINANISNVSLIQQERDEYHQKYLEGMASYNSVEVVRGLIATDNLRLQADVSDLKKKCTDFETKCENLNKEILRHRNESSLRHDDQERHKNIRRTAEFEEKIRSFYVNALNEKDERIAELERELESHKILAQNQQHEHQSVMDQMTAKLALFENSSAENVKLVTMLQTLNSEVSIRLETVDAANDALKEENFDLRSQVDKFSTERRDIDERARLQSIDHRRLLDESILYENKITSAFQLADQAKREFDAKLEEISTENRQLKANMAVHENRLRKYDAELAEQRIQTARAKSELKIIEGNFVVCEENLQKELASTFISVCKLSRSYCTKSIVDDMKDMTSIDIMQKIRRTIDGAIEKDERDRTVYGSPPAKRRRLSLPEHPVIVNNEVADSSFSSFEPDSTSTVHRVKTRRQHRLEQQKRAEETANETETLGLGLNTTSLNGNFYVTCCGDGGSFIDDSTDKVLSAQLDIDEN